MSNDNARRTRSTSGNAPMGSTVAIVVTAIAIVLGFLILRKINDDDNGGAIKPTTTTTTTIAGGVTTTLPSQVTTTTTALVKTGTKVQVANASNASGVAKAMSTALATEGFDLAAATNSTANPKLEKSKVIYDPANTSALAVANSLAAVLGNLPVEAAGTPVPVEGAGFAEGSGVILLLGNDIAGKTLAQINGGVVTGTTAPPTTTG